MKDLLTFRRPALCLMALLLQAPISAATLENGDPKIPRIESEAVLFGTVESSESRIRFYWETRNWPLWLAGYRIKYRNSSDDQWTDLHPDPILPTFDPVRDWSNQGLRPDEVASLMTARQATFAKRISDRPTGEVLSLLRQYNGLQSGDRLSQKLDYNIALFSGFACIQHLDPVELESLTSREYGLFAVDDKGTSSPGPVSTWTTKVHPEGSGAPDVVEFDVDDGVVMIQWKYSKEEARQRGLFGFTVYRQEAGSEEWNRVVQTPLGRTGEDGDNDQYLFLDLEANPTRDARYAVVAQDVFQNEYSRIEDSFVADRFRSLPSPEIVGHKIVNDADVLLDWSFPADHAGRVKGFFVERSEKGVFSRISQLLIPSSRSFSDRDTKEYGRVYDYRIVAIDQYDQEWTGLRKVVLYLGQSKPPAPEDLRGRFLVKEGVPGILLEWEGYATQNSRTAYFRVLSDVTEPGVPRIQSQIEPFQGNRFFYPLNINGGRWLNIGLLPVTPEGITGDPATVEVYMPTIKLPAVTGLKSNFNEKDYSVYLVWNYAEELIDLRGFRILMNGEVVLDSQGLPPDSRQATVVHDNFGKGKSFKFSIVAVGGVEDSSPSVPTAVYIQSERLPEGVQAPDELAVALLEPPDNGPSAVLTWKPVEDFEEAGLKGYALMVDYAQEGNIRRLNSIPPLEGPSYQYRLPKLDDRKVFTFRIAAITKDNQLWPFAEATLELPEPPVDLQTETTN
jgi:hypothetical protein